MNTKQIDYLNIGLIFLSLFLAIYVPFQLFLFSYAFIGPLHYVTEINWLNDKKYFINHSKKWIIAFAILGLLISIYPIIKYLDDTFKLDLSNGFKWFANHTNHFLLISLLLSICLVILKSTKQIIIGILLSLLLVTWIKDTNKDLLILTGLFLPTLIHVYLFTLIFVLFGAKKSKNSSGFILGGILALVPIIIIFLPIKEEAYILSKDTLQTFISSSMINVSSKISNFIEPIKNNRFNLTSVINVKIQIFIAFAYTYHYLNWFSKTSIIGWKKNLSGAKIWATLLIWALSIALYLYDFKLGFIALFYLSFLHVILELPLNIVSLKELFKFKPQKS